MNQIYSASPEGQSSKQPLVLSELLTKFESGKSMLDAVLLKRNPREGFRILRQAVKADKALHNYRISMIKGRLKSSEQVDLPNMVCPSAISQILRDNLWGKRVEGVTQSPVSQMVKIVTLSEALEIPNADLSFFSQF